jgi:acylphosphatase
MKAKEITIKGKVHDVGYRLFLLSEAEELLIGKFDARKVLVEGEQHLFVRVEGAEEKVSRFAEFADMLGKQDKTIEILESVKGDTSKMLEKQDMMLEKQDETISVIKEESEKTREVARDEGEKMREVVSVESEKTRVVLKEKVEEDVEWIKEEIIGIKATLEKVTEKVGVN